MKPILVAGEINADLIFSGCEQLPEPGVEVLAEGFRQVPGSSSMICAMGLARLGESVAFVGRAGRDPLGTFCIDALRGAGIDVAAVVQEERLATGVSVALSTAKDRALVTCTGAIDALQAADVEDALLARARHLHVSSYYLQRRLRPQLGELFARARAAGLSTSLDPGFDPERRWGDAWPELLREVDVFLPNLVEARAISGCDDAGAALRAMDNGVTRTVIKCGGDGAATLENGRLLQMPAHPVAMRDSTGAGDSFDAGFLHAWLAERPLAACLRWGNVCGSLSTRGIGGTECQAREDEVRALLGDDA